MELGEVDFVGERLVGGDGLGGLVGGELGEFCADGGVGGFSVLWGELGDAGAGELALVRFRVLRVHD